MVDLSAQLGRMPTAALEAEMAFINTLYNHWPNGDQKVGRLRDGIAATALAVFQKYKISTSLLVAHIMAQISHECGACHDVVESLNYSAERMTEVWPGRFPTVAAAAPYVDNEIALGVKAYGGRMGNRPIGSIDGQVDGLTVPAIRSG